MDLEWPTCNGEFPPRHRGVGGLFLPYPWQTTAPVQQLFSRPPPHVAPFIVCSALAPKPFKPLTPPRSPSLRRARLRRAGAAAPLLRACRHRHLAVAESALRAVQSLAECDDGASAAVTSAGNGGGGPAAGAGGSFRAQLVDAGALGTLQSLQVRHEGSEVLADAPFCPLSPPILTSQDVVKVKALSLGRRYGTARP
jgi:hypothetical protein